MSKSPLDPTVAEQAPEADDLTAYDREHLVTYLRLLDADAEGADWAEVARIVEREPPADSTRGVERQGYPADGTLAGTRSVTPAAAATVRRRRSVTL